MLKMKFVWMKKVCLKNVALIVQNGKSNKVDNQLDNYKEMWIYTKPNAHTKLSQYKFELEFGLDNGSVYRSWSNNLYFYIKSLFYVIDNYINKKNWLWK